MHQNIKSYK